MSARAPLSSEHDLVRFLKPPVGEVALAIQFAGEVVDLEVLADFRQSIKADFPQHEQQPALPRMQESFDAPPEVPNLQIRFSSPTALPRTWFLTKDGRRLIQLQGDRMSLNWRRLEDADEYPRYSRLRESFLQHVQRLYDCVRASSDQVPAIDLIEISYVNPIEPPETPEPGTHPDLARIVNLLSPTSARSFLSKPEDAVYQARWRIPGQELGAAGPVGRLHVSAVPALKPPGPTPIYMLNVSGRVTPLDGTLDGARAAMDVGHRWVALGFEDLTTPEMHALWERQERS